MNRRDFLALAAGGTVALAITRALPLTTRHSWNLVKVNRFHQPADMNAYVGTIIGQRSDERWFYSAVVIPTDEFTPARIDTSLDNARRSLDTFLDCDCAPGRPCAEHYIAPLEPTLADA